MGRAEDEEDRPEDHGPEDQPQARERVGYDEELPQREGEPGGARRDGDERDELQPRRDGESPPRGPGPRSSPRAGRRGRLRRGPPTTQSRARGPPPRRRRA